MEENENLILEEEPKTFTEDDINEMISQKLAEEKAKMESEYLEREQELQQKEFNLYAKEKMSTAGLPLELLQVFNCTDNDSLDNSIKLFKDMGFVDKHNKSQSVIIKDEIKLLLTEEGFNPDVLNLAVNNFDLNKIEFDGKNITNWNEVLEPFKEKNSGYFGVRVTEGVKPAILPANYTAKSVDDYFKKGFNDVD